MAEIEIKELGNSEIELTGEISAADFGAERAKALDHLNQTITLDGFRQGHAPEAVLVAKLGEERVLLEMAELALAGWYPKIVVEKSLAVIGRPEITITKLAKDNPLGFKIKTAVQPQFPLPDYRTLAKEQNRQPLAPVVIEEKELDDLLAEVKKQSTANKELPPDEELRVKIRENLKLEKEHKARDKRRLAIMQTLIEKSEIPLPTILIESELDRMLAELKSDLERVGLQYTNYLTHLKKTEAELREAWRPEAINRIKTGLLLDRIATAEKLSPEPAAVEAEVKHLQTHYQEVSAERVQAYVLSILTNEKVWQFLEAQK